MSASSSGLALCLVLLLSAGQSLAQIAPAPFVSANRSPLIAPFGLPSAYAAKLPAAGQSQWLLQWEAANYFSLTQHGDEAIFLDGEAQRLQLAARYGLDERWALDLELPYISYQAGGLDHFIDDWHDFWNLPRGDRADYPRDRLRIRYRRDGQTLLDIAQPSTGWSDPRLGLAYQLPDYAGQHWALRATVKPALSEHAALLGSGSTDIALSVALSRAQADLWQWHGSAGLLWLSGGGLLAELRREAVGFASLSLSRTLGSRIALRLQVDGHTAFYHSDLDELGIGSLQLLMGGTLGLSPHWQLDLAVSEDIAVDTAPDVLFLLGLRWRP